jgi:hypothetical protein
MQWIDVYTVSTDGTVNALHGGSGLKYSERPYRHHRHIFELRLEPQKTNHLYLRISSEGSKSISLRLFRADVFAQSTSHDLAMLTMYAGIIVALACYPDGQVKFPRLWPGQNPPGRTCGLLV